MISKRAYPTAIKYNDILHIFGGYDYDHGILKSSETINPDGQAKVEGHFSFKSFDFCFHYIKFSTILLFNKSSTKDFSMRFIKLISGFEAEKHQSIKDQAYLYYFLGSLETLTESM